MGDEKELDVRPEVKRFALLMEEVLRTHDSKGGWKECTPRYLLARMLEEMAEVIESMCKDSFKAVALPFKDMAEYLHRYGSDEAVQFPPWTELADVANFAMMLHDVSHNERSKDGN